MIKTLLKKLICLFFLVLLLPQLASAQNLQNAFGDNSALDASADKAGYDITSYAVEPIIGTVIQTFLSILGVIFLILMIYAGYNWMTAHGDEQKVTKAKETITAAIIGLVVVIGAYAISFYVIKSLSVDALRTSGQ